MVRNLDHPAHILLVDSDPHAYQRAKAMLSSAYVLDWRQDASQALDTLFCAQYDAVLVDDHIGIDTALAMIRAARERGCTLPIILITDANDAQIDNQAMQAGASDYLNRAEITPALFERTIRYDIRSVLQSLEAERITQTEQLRLQTVIENAPSGIVMTDAQGNFTVVNPTAHKLFPAAGITGTAAGPSGGYTLLCMNGAAFQTDDLPLMRTLKGEVVRNEEMLIRHDDGREIYTLINTTPIWEGGKITGAVGAIRDISDYIQARRALAQSEERELVRARELEAIMNAVPAAVWIARDPDSKVIESNSYGYQILRMQPGQNTSKSAQDGAAPAHFKLMKDGRELSPEEMPVQIAARGTPVFDFEYDIVFDDGEVRHMLGNAMPMLQDGLPAGAVSAILDITERKNIEEVLATSEERFRQASDAMNGFVWDYDLLTGKIYRSEGIFQVIGYTNAELPPTYQAWKDLIHPQDTAIGLPVDMIEHTRGNQTYTGSHYRVRHRNGGWVWVRSHGKVFHDADGQPVRMVGATINITQEKEAEMALRESNERFRLVLDNTPTTIFTMDTDLRYTWIYNPREDFTSEGVIGKRDDELLEPDAAEILMAPKREVLVTGKPVRRELSYSINGKPVAYNVAIEPMLSPDGVVVGLSAIAMDVTDLAVLRSQQIEDRAHIEIQRRLIQQREQERLQIARDLHDGPLQTFTAAYYAAQGLMDACQELPQSHKEFENLKHDLQAGITELRAYASELRPPTLASFGLEKAIDAHLKEFRNRYPGIEVRFEARQIGPILPETPRMAMYRIYQELINNIVKHAAATQIHIRFLKTLTDAELVIEDNGKGFAPPKDWLELARNKHLGLVGVRERAEAVGGQVEIWSSQERGTTVRVYVSLEGQE